MNARASDAELASRCLSARGEPAQAAFRELYDRHAPALRRFLGGRLGPDRAADAVQETFLRAYTGLASYQPERSLRGWLYGIARNVALHVQRAEGRRPTSPWPATDPAARGDTPRGAVQRAEEQRLVRQAVDGLPEREREVFLLRQVEGLTYAEVAQVTETSLRTAKYRMRAAADLLAAELARIGLLPTGGEA